MPAPELTVVIPAYNEAQRLGATLDRVLEYLASGMTEQEILTDFPELTQTDIRACLAFAADRERRLTQLSS